MATENNVADLAAWREKRQAAKRERRFREWERDNLGSNQPEPPRPAA